MAELAAIGLASSIVAFIDFGTKVAARLTEFERALSQGVDPKLYRDIRIELPLLLDTLKRTREQADQGNVNEATQQALLPVVQGCHVQVESLNDLLDSLPMANDSSWRRGLKTISSVRREKKFYETVETIKGYVQYLTYHQAAAPIIVNAMEIPKSLVQQQPISTPIFMVPFERDEDYVQRSNLLTDIDRRFETQRRAALSGIGGVGKSQIAVEYCYCFRDQRPDANIFWIFAASIPRLHQGYKAIAKRLKIPGWDDLNVDSFVLIKEWMSDSENGSWLLILDGADDMNIFFPPLGKMSEYDTQRHDMAEWLPRSPHGSILIITRDRRLGERLTDRGKPFSVEPMGATAAEQLFRLRISVRGREDEDSESLKELLELLGHLPLAIVQAASFISENDITFPEYLSAIMDDSNQIQEMLDLDFGDHRRYAESGSSILRTWKLSFNQIREQQPLAAKILSLMATLDL